ncbi:MAG: DUF4160 domain-containing protein [Proteobacteria bacterium]|nr:DUF4160 domain-containing protein [Pseudomonadota bacterium]
MPTLARFAGFEIAMYFEDHNPPHVHVVGPDFEMLVAIRNDAVLAGEAPARVRRMALRWIAANRDELLTRWEDYH